ncbi:hypothetical protein UlMin_037652 [Ulmus minor]
MANKAKHIEDLYEFDERLNESKDKSQGIIDATKTSTKDKQLAAQLIPRFLKFFPDLSSPTIDTHLDLVEEEELGVRVQAIRGLPLFCKDTPEHIAKIVDILVQLLTAKEFVELDAVHKDLMALLSVFPNCHWNFVLLSHELIFSTISSFVARSHNLLVRAASLTTLFKHIGCVDEPSIDEFIRKKVLSFIRDKVFPIKAELLKPQDEMERYITNLIKKSLEDVTRVEFRMFMDFLKSLSIFGEKAPPERMKELIGIIEGQANLDAQLNMSLFSRLVHCPSIAPRLSLDYTSILKTSAIVPTFTIFLEKLTLALMVAACKLHPYFQAHTIIKMAFYLEKAKELLVQFETKTNLKLAGYNSDQQGIIWTKINFTRELQIFENKKKKESQKLKIAFHENGKSKANIPL